MALFYPLPIVCEGLHIPFAAAGILASEKALAPQWRFFVRLRSLVRKRPESVCTQKNNAIRRCFFACGE